MSTLNKRRSQDKITRDSTAIIQGRRFQALQVTSLIKHPENMIHTSINVEFSENDKTLYHPPTHLVIFTEIPTTMHLILLQIVRTKKTQILRS